MAQVPDQVYHRVFRQDADGAAILDDLAGRYCGQTHTPGDPYETAFREGQRSVVSYLDQRAGIEGA